MAADVGVWHAKSCGDPGGRHSKAGIVVGYSVAGGQFLRLAPDAAFAAKEVSRALFRVSPDIGERCTR